MLYTKFYKEKYLLFSYISNISPDYVKEHLQLELWKTKSLKYARLSKSSLMLFFLKILNVNPLLNYIFMFQKKTFFWNLKQKASTGFLWNYKNYVIFSQYLKKKIWKWNKQKFFYFFYYKLLVDFI